MITVPWGKKTGSVEFGPFAFVTTRLPAGNGHSASNVVHFIVQVTARVSWQLLIVRFDEP